MSVWIVVQRPVSGVDRASVAEATRAIAAQGAPKVPDPQRVARLLWAARALPVALDALADARAGLRVDQLILQGMACLRHPPLDGRAPGTLHAVGVHEAGTERVEVRFVDAAKLAAGEAIRDHALALAELSFLTDGGVQDDTDPSSPAIAVTRFVHGPLGVKAEGSDS